MMLGLNTVAFLALQIVAALFFKWGSMPEHPWWIGFVCG